MQKNKLPRPISILVLTLLTTVVWISLNIYRAVTTTKVPPSVPEDVSRALTPSLDKTTIEKIQAAVFFEDSQIPDVVSSSTSVATPKPEVVPTPESTASAEPVPVTE